jgi:ankyrin repeat protein
MSDLCESVETGDLQKVREAIAKGAHVNTTCLASSPLNRAAFLGYKDVASYLIEKGANVNARGEFSFNTPLYDATAQGNLDMAGFLIEKGADVNARNFDQETALHRAARDGNLPIVELLVMKGADVKAISRSDTPLHQAVARMGQDSPAKLRITELLIAKGADVNAKGFGGSTPLHINSRRDIAELLIASGAEVNAKNDEGNTPLHYAIRYYRGTDIIVLLIDNGADVNARNREGLTPIGLMQLMIKNDPRIRFNPAVREILKEHGGHE